MKDKNLPENLTDLAKEFAEHMDANRYIEAGVILSPECRYKFRDDIFLGKDAILKTYIDNYNSALKKLDEIQFSSEIIPLGNGVFKLKYLDRIRKGEITHDHRCEQIISFKSGEIVEIEHIDLSGEDESLQAFFRKIGSN